MKLTTITRITVLLIATAAFGTDGATRRIDPPAVPGAMAVNIASIENVVHVSWIEPAERETDDGPRRLRWASFSGGAWSPARTIVERDDFFANWADVPSITVAGDGALFAHWLQKSGADTYAYDVMVARSSDEGVTWATLGALHDDKTETEHGFVSAVATETGVRMFWLDGRAMSTDAHGSSHGTGSMALRTALIGETIGASVVLDDRVCECCGTSAALTDRGPIVVYRDRGEREVRDISLVRAIGPRWTAPRPVHADGWMIAGCPVNGPAIDARGPGVVTAWYTGATESGSVRATFSVDRGASFGPAVTIDAMRPLGRVDVVMTDRETAIVSWLTDREGTGAIMACRVTPSGPGPAIRVANTSLARQSGFAKIAIVDDHLLVLWTDDRETTHLRASILPVSRLRSE